MQGEKKKKTFSIYFHSNKGENMGWQIVNYVTKLHLSGKVQNYDKVSEFQ